MDLLKQQEAYNLIRSHNDKITTKHLVHELALNPVVQETLHHLGIHIRPSNLRVAVQSMDTNHDKLISMGQFVSYIKRQSIQEVYALIGSNCDGEITMNHMVRALILNPLVQQRLHRLGMDTKPQAYRDSLHSMDTDHNASITIDEFTKYIHRCVSFQKFSSRVEKALKSDNNNNNNQDTAFAEDEDPEYIELIHLHQEQWALKKLIQDAEAARAGPNILLYFEKKKQEIFSMWKEWTTNTRNKKSVKALESTAAANVSTIQEEIEKPKDFVSMVQEEEDIEEPAYWLKYVDQLPADQARMKRALSVLTDDAVTTMGYAHERRSALVLSRTLLPSPFLNRLPLTTPLLTPTPLQAKVLGSSISMPNLGMTAASRGTKTTTRRTYRKRIWIPTNVTLASLMHG